MSVLSRWCPSMGGGWRACAHRGEGVSGLSVGRLIDNLLFPEYAIAMMLAIDSGRELLLDFGKKVKRMRLHCNLTRHEVAHRSGVPYSTLRRLETTGEGSMRDYIRVFQALNRMDELASLIKAPSVMPACTKERERARASRKTVAQGFGEPVVLIRDYPQLQAIAWNRREDATCSEAEALALYERNWRFVDQGALLSPERAFIDRLVATHGNGVLHV